MNFDTLVRSGETNFGKILAALLVDGIDRSFLDSGGIYGTSQQRHKQGAAALTITPHEYFEAQAETRMKMTQWGLEWYHNLYHWLQEKVSYRADITMKFYDFMDFAYAHDNKGYMPVKLEDRTWQVSENYTTGAQFFLNHIWQIWPDTAQDWDDMPLEEWQARYDMLSEWLRSRPNGYDPNLIGGEGEFTEYTYNRENMVSQDFQYYSFPWDGDWIYAISIHGGADTRSGFHSVIFCEGNDGWYDLSYITDGSLWCNECDASWYTDDGGYHIYGSNREDDLDRDALEEHAERDAEGELTGEIICPVCGKGKLHASY